MQVVDAEKKYSDVISSMKTYGVTGKTNPIIGT
jgi:hypothetical protein